MAALISSGEKFSAAIKRQLTLDIAAQEEHVADLYRVISGPADSYGRRWLHGNVVNTNHLAAEKAILERWKAKRAKMNTCITN